LEQCSGGGPQATFAEENQHKSDNGFMVEQAGGGFGLAKRLFLRRQIGGALKLVGKSSGEIFSHTDQNALMERLQALSP
jgi:hypothetical protein